MPEFARRYNLSYAACHAVFPRLNKFGEHFAKSNMRLPNWMESANQLGDDRLALPDHILIAIRAQAHVQARQGKAIDPVTSASQYVATDFQSSYLVKLLSSAPLSKDITYYFYAIMAEKGGNGEVVVEDAWFGHASILGSGIGMMLGQFSPSDSVFPREIRLPFQDFMVCRMAGITYDRGVLFDLELGPFSIDLGFTNGKASRPTSSSTAPVMVARTGCSTTTFPRPPLPISASTSDRWVQGCSPPPANSAAPPDRLAWTQASAIPTYGSPALTPPAISAAMPTGMRSTCGIAGTAF